MRAEAHRKDRHAIVEHCRQEVLLEAQPWVAVLLVRVHGSAEGEHGVVVGDLAGRPGTLFGQGPLVELHAAVTHLVGEDAGAGVGLVHNGEGAHR